jgi:hypothetical protein
MKDKKSVILVNLKDNTHKMAVFDQLKRGKYGFYIYT